MDAAPTPPPVAPLPPAWRAYVLGLIGAGALIGAFALGALVLSLVRGPAPTLSQWALAGTLGVGSWLVLRHLLLFDWRGQRVALGPDEALVFIALVALPTPLVVLFAFPTMLTYQFVTRRDVLRGGANVGVLLASTAVAVLAHGAVAALGAPSFVAALVAIPLYTVTNLALVSGAFALIEGTSAATVYRERFLVPTAFHVLLGWMLGPAVVALWSFHPATVLTLAPLLYFARDHVRLLARTDREANVHKYLEEVSRTLVGEDEIDSVAQQVLSTCGQIFRAGRVTLTLARGTDKAQTWARDFEPGPRPGARPLAEVLGGEDGRPVGALIVYPTLATHESFGAPDRALLRIVAGEASAFVANAGALGALEDSRKALLSSRVARPLVRRIVRSLMEETRADHHVLMRLGEGLAREADLDASSGPRPVGVAGSGKSSDADAHDLATLCAAYEDMGLGSIKVDEAKGSQFAFVGHDLFERQAGAHATTCYIAMGFLVGATSRLHGGKPARASEVACQSRGDPACRFVVQVRDPETAEKTRSAGTQAPPPSFHLPGWGPPKRPSQGPAQPR